MEGGLVCDFFVGIMDMALQTDGAGVSKTFHIYSLRRHDDFLPGQSWLVYILVWEGTCRLSLIHGR